MSVQGKAVVAFSGGMDSATCLIQAIREYGVDNVIAVGFTYGGKHNQWERAAASDFVNRCEMPPANYRVVDLTEAFKGFKSDLLKSSSNPIPEGHYEAASMSRTVVPGRNMIFATILAGIAWSEEAGEVWLGVHAGDHAIYPDCRPEFVRAMNEAIRQGTDGRVSLRTPFLHANKAKILEIGFPLGVPYELTRTCYCDQPVACGRCGSCGERLEAFQKIGRNDPLLYVSREIMSKDQAAV